MQRQQPMQPPPSVNPVQDTYLAANANEAKFHPLFGVDFKGDYDSLSDEDLFHGMLALMESAYETEIRVLEQGLAQTRPMLIQVAAQGTATEKRFVPSLERVYAITAARIKAQKRFIGIVNLQEKESRIFREKEGRILRKLKELESEGKAGGDGAGDSSGTEEVDPPGTDGDSKGVSNEGVDKPK